MFVCNWLSKTHIIALKKQEIQNKRKNFEKEKFIFFSLYPQHKLRRPDPTWVRRQST